MKNIILILFIIGALNSCDNKKISHKEAVSTYYKALDSGEFNKIKEVIHDSITLISGDFVMPFDKNTFYEFYTWDSIFKPSYEVIELVEENDDVIATISQKNIRNAFLKNNPLKLNVKISFVSGKITKIEELDYIDVNWDTWSQRRDSLVSLVIVKHPKLDGFVNDMTMKGAVNYLKAMELYKTQEDRELIKQ
ncbi:hypothetical protein CLV90_0677 [Maribacter spongiicola]|uniref:SnoaL-like protein n=1 Tax=Maribacter spongiicola TaxID=1206753 RepID=A0A4R7K7N3_9FLAO|nr:hypothetical protein [Maribacter spongiicola]TDT46622.1 hypothetical protein CLV90_0677 [Maribacter spongiicola]